MRATVVAPIRGWGNAWKVAGPTDPAEQIHLRAVALEIQGDGANGYHLVMSPDGCFTADTWHETIEDAKAAASEIYGLHPEGWS